VEKDFEIKDTIKFPSHFESWGIDFCGQEAIERLWNK